MSWDGRRGGAVTTGSCAFRPIGSARVSVASQMQQAPLLMVKQPPNGILMRPSLKMVLVPALLIALPAISSGQSIGIRGGLSIASVGGNDAADTGSTNGVSVVAFYNMPLPGILGAQIGVGFTQRGFTRTVFGVTPEGRIAPADSSVESTVDLSYADIPLLLTLSPVSFGNLGFNLSTGLVLSLMTGCSVTFSDDSVSTTFACTKREARLKTSTLDVGVMVGAGMELGLTGNASLLLDVFYNLGLSKVDRSGVDDDIKNRTLSILVGASFAVNR